MEKLEKNKTLWKNGNLIHMYSYLTGHPYISLAVKYSQPNTLN